MDNRATLDTARCRFPTLKSSIARSDVTIDNTAINDGEWCVGEGGIIDLDFIIPIQQETISETGFF